MTAAKLRAVRLVRAVIDFPEQLVVLLDVRVIRIELESLLIGRAGLFEFALLFVADRQIVVRRGVCRVRLGGAFPMGDRLAPQSEPRNLDSKLDLILRVLAFVGRERCRGRGNEKQGDNDSRNSKSGLAQ